MQKMTAPQRRAADAARNKSWPSTYDEPVHDDRGKFSHMQTIGLRAAWIAGENGEPVFAMVPHSTPPGGPSWVYIPADAWRHRRARQDWRDRREGERQRVGGV
jgi:hypothetical protein